MSRKRVLRGIKDILAVNVGAFPRIGDLPEEQKLRDAIEFFERSEITEHELAGVREETIRGVLADQARAGLDIVSDGQVRWHDPVSHLMGRLGGVRMAGLRRYFDTGRFYLQPRIIGKLEAGRPLIADELKWARAVSMRPVVAVLPGPLSLSRLVDIRGGPYADANSLAEALVPLLADEVGNLVKAGAAAIVVEEPMLLREPAALPLVAGAMEVLAARKGSLRLWLFPSLGDPVVLFESLQKMAVDGLMLDCSAGRKIKDAISGSGSQLCLALGVLDARSARIEPPAVLATQAELLLKRFRGETVWLCPSADLEYLPRGLAWEKLAALAHARDLLLGKRPLLRGPARKTMRRKPRSKKVPGSPKTARRRGRK